MPKPMQFRASSLIYFQGDPADKVFILQSGKVSLAYQNIETGEDMRDLVQPGEFFGVKSALGRYPREENAMALQDAVIMAFPVPEFEALAAANTRIIMKMLKVFSNQMRRIHAQVSSLMTKEEQVNPEAGLFNVGQYYLKNKRFSQAKYIFSRYLTYYPTGRYAQQAAKDLETAAISIAKGGSAAPIAAVGVASAAAPASPAPSMAAAAPADMTDMAKAYYDAVSLISQQKYQQAYLGFKRIVDANSDAEYAAKSTFEIGRCLFLMNKFDDCIKYYTMMITKYPKHPDLADALFYMGQSYEKNNSKDQAATFYRKIISMPGNEEDGSHVKAKRALKALEA
jgi:TolA-binding protein